MTTNPTMRVVWFDGRPFPVSSHPRGLADPGTHWHVQTPDGDWHAVRSRRAGETKDEEWLNVITAVLAWLENWSAGRQDTAE